MKRKLTRFQRVLCPHSGGFNIPFNGLWSLATKSLQWRVPLIYCFPSKCTYINTLHGSLYTCLRNAKTYQFIVIGMYVHLFE